MRCLGTTQQDHGLSQTDPASNPSSAASRCVPSSVTLRPGQQGPLPWALHFRGPHSGPPLTTPGQGIWRTKGPWSPRAGRHIRDPTQVTRTSFSAQRAPNQPPEPARALPGTTPPRGWLKMAVCRGCAWASFTSTTAINAPLALVPLSCLLFFKHTLVFPQLKPSFPPHLLWVRPTRWSCSVNLSIFTSLMPPLSSWSTQVPHPLGSQRTLECFCYNIYHRKLWGHLII